MAESRTYILSSKRRLSGAGSTADAELTRVSDVTPEEVGRAALEVARREKEDVVITASHWPAVPIGALRTRLSAVEVAPDDLLSYVVGEILEVERS